jgi:hypothetical protein
MAFPPATRSRRPRGTPEQAEVDITAAINRLASQLDDLVKVAPRRPREHEVVAEEFDGQNDGGNMEP